MAGERILIIDDNITNLKLFKVLLTIEGYDVMTAADANQALTALATYQPRLILMDVQLPGMDGYELTREIKRNPELTGVIIVAVTASAINGDMEKAIAAGCDGYISKPIDINTFSSEIKKYLTGDIHQ